MSVIVEACGLSKSHQEGASARAILEDVSFVVERGEFVCIMGPSGSGKSTLLHLLSGLDQPSEGWVLLDGLEISRLSERGRTLARRSRVGYVFQFFNLLPNLTVEENIALPVAIGGRSLKREVRERVAELARRLRIAGRLHALPHQLSGGEMQRVSLARALMGGQALLLCDEPTGNLSQRAGAEVMGLLRSACDDDGRSVLLVTHNPRDAAYADRVLFLVDGRLKERELRGPSLTVGEIHGALEELSI